MLHASINKSYVIPRDFKPKYEKFLVTIALRLGIGVKYPEDIQLGFKGKFVEHNTSLRYGIGPGKNDSFNYAGSLTVNGKAFTDTEVIICTPREDQNKIITLWPVYKDSYRSQIKKHTLTEPFIEEYQSGRLNLTISDIANYYSPLFTKNPNRTPLDMAFEVGKIKDDLNEDKKEKLKAKHAEETRKNEARSRKEKAEQEQEFLKNMERANKENEAREKEFKKLLKQQKQKQKETSKPKPDIDWTSSEITSAVFNYYEDSNQHLKIYINNKKIPIKLDKKLWKLQYSAALKSSKNLEKGDIFEYITQGINKLSPKESFNQLIINKYNDKREETQESFDDDNIVNEALERVKYSLNHQSISDLNNTKFTFNTTFNVLDTFLIPGDEFRKHYGFQWKNPMILIKTDVGWYINAAINSKGDTNWTRGEHHNCRISLTKGKEHPYWLEK